MVRNEYINEQLAGVRATRHGEAEIYGWTVGSG